MAEAIILKTGSMGVGGSKKIVLFDAELGKIEVMVAVHNRKKTGLVYGGLVRCSLQEWRTLFFAQDLELLSVPSIKDGDDLLFVHHWLELVDLFCSYNQPNRQIYDLLKGLYQLESYPSLISRKILLVKFFALLGIYPSSQSNLDEDFLSLILASRDTMLSNDEESPSAQASLNRWLTECLASHPEKSLIKTMAFLKR